MGFSMFEAREMRVRRARPVRGANWSELTEVPVHRGVRFRAETVFYLPHPAHFRAGRRAGPENRCNILPQSDARRVTSIQSPWPRLSCSCPVPFSRCRQGECFSIRRECQHLANSIARR